MGGIISVSDIAPTVDGADISMLDTTGVFDAGGDEGHLWNDRPVQGQTFTTGSFAAGYLLHAITLQDLASNNNRNISQYTVRVGTIAGNTFSLVGSEVSSNTQIAFFSLDYVTMIYDTPIFLNADTVYGFDWGPNHFGFITSNNGNSNYAGGQAYSSGDNSVPDDNNLLFRDLDRVFHLDLTAVPEPAMLSLLVLGGLLALIRRRK
jgi:hypothetical protein